MAGRTSAGPGESGAAASGAFPMGGTTWSLAGASGSTSFAGRSSGGTSAGSLGTVDPEAGAAGSAEGPPGACAARPGLLFCDDFEDREPGAFEPSAPWSLAINGLGRVHVDSKQSRSGSRAVHVEGNGYSTYLSYGDASVLPVLSRRFYLRVFVRLAKPMVEGLNVFITIDNKALAGKGRTLQVGEMNEMLVYSAGSGQGASANGNYYLDYLPGKGFTAGAWSCLELLVDSKAGEIAVWLDEREIPDMHRYALVLDTYDRARFGFENFTGPATELWYDDIAIGTQPIGCD